VLMKIVIVEDDFLQAGNMRGWLTEAWPSAEVVLLETESAFRQAVPLFEQSPPDIFIMDVMLRWADPGPDMIAAPEDVHADGYHRAGMRCAENILATECLNTVPIVLYSVLDGSDLADSLDQFPQHVKSLQKAASRDGLLMLAGSLLAARGPTKAAAEPDVSAQMNEPSSRGEEGLRYDVALSFSGEDRSKAAALARELSNQGIRVFYDRYEQAHLWGKDLYQHLQSVYRDRARFCVVFVSASYASRLWTRHELRQAQARAFTENREYILPLRLDDTELPGINTTVGYVDARKTSTTEIVSLVMAKLAEGLTGTSAEIGRDGE